MTTKRIHVILGEAKDLNIVHPDKRLLIQQHSAKNLWLFASYRGIPPQLFEPYSRSSALRISARLILPPTVLGSSSTYSITRGYL